MELKDLFTKEKVVTEFAVEVFKGDLIKSAVIDAIKKEFADNENLMEGVLISDKAEGKPIDIINNKLLFKIKASDDFRVSYLACVNNDKKLTKITAIISEGVDAELQQILDDNKQMLRIQK